MHHTSISARRILSNRCRNDFESLNCMQIVSCHLLHKTANTPCIYLLRHSMIQRGMRYRKTRLYVSSRAQETSDAMTPGHALCLPICPCMILCTCDIPSLPTIPCPHCPHCVSLARSSIHQFACDSLPVIIPHVRADLFTASKGIVHRP